MDHTPTEEQLVLLRRAHPAALQLRDDLDPLITDYLTDGHVEQLIIHYLMFAAYTLADQLYPAHNLTAESATVDNYYRAEG